MWAQGRHFTAPAPPRGEPSGHLLWWEGSGAPCQEGLCSDLGAESAVTPAGLGPQASLRCSFRPPPPTPKPPWSPRPAGLLWFSTQACTVPVARNSKAANSTPGTCTLLGDCLGQQPAQQGAGGRGLGGEEGHRGNSGKRLWGYLSVLSHHRHRQGKRPTSGRPAGQRPTGSQRAAARASARLSRSSCGCTWRPGGEDSRLRQSGPGLRAPGSAVLALWDQLPPRGL